MATARPVRKKTPAAEHPGVGKGLDPTFLAGGAGVLVLGLIAAGIGFFTRFGLRLGPIPIPLSIVGPLIAVGGIVVIALSFRQQKCLQCNQSLTPARAWFPLASEGDVLDAVAANPEALNALEMGSPAEPSMQVSIEYCEKCSAVAAVEVSAFRPEREVLVTQVMTGPSVAALMAVMTARDEAHTERFEAEEAET